MKKITLDLDDICFAALESRIEYFKKWNKSKEITVYESPSMSGYHVIIELNSPITDRAAFEKRYEFGDDPKRLVRNMLGYEELLFKFKLEKSGKHEFLHISTYLFKWIKINEIEWKKIPEQRENKNSLTSIPKQSEQLQRVLQS